MVTLPVAVSRWARFVSVDSDTGCWNWTGGTNGYGYGRCSFGRRHQPVAGYAHRAFYAALVGPIPAGLQIDHLCRNKLCANPAHLEPVTARENCRRARPLRCPSGHLYDPATTYVRLGGERTCRRCHTLLERRRRHEAALVRIGDGVAERPWRSHRGSVDACARCAA